MRVFILHSAVRPGAPPEERDTLVTADAIRHALTTLGYDATLGVFATPFEAVVDAVRDAQTEVVFNMVESVCGEDSLAACAPALIEGNGIPYTGSGAAAIALAADKPLAKRLMRAAGLPTPDWAEPPGWERLRNGGAWIVKSATKHASLGLDRFSVVTERPAVLARARECAVRFGGRWFAEAYVEGREVNAALLEKEGSPIVLPMAEMQFLDWPEHEPRIVGYGAKWDESSREYIHTVRRFGIEDEEPRLAERLKDISVQVWNLFGLQGYARIDFRLDERFEPTVIEINPNPCLEPRAGFAAAAAKAGIPYAELLAMIVAAAFRTS